MRHKCMCHCVMCSAHGIVKAQTGGAALLHRRWVALLRSTSSSGRRRRLALRTRPGPCSAGPRCDAKPAAEARHTSLASEPVSKVVHTRGVGPLHCHRKGHLTPGLALQEAHHANVLRALEANRRLQARLQQARPCPAPAAQRATTPFGLTARPGGRLVLTGRPGGHPQTRPVQGSLTYEHLLSVPLTAQAPA